MVRLIHRLLASVWQKNRRKIIKRQFVTVTACNHKHHCCHWIQNHTRLWHIVTLWFYVRWHKKGLDWGFRSWKIQRARGGEAGIQTTRTQTQTWWLPVTPKKKKKPKKTPITYSRSEKEMNWHILWSIWFTPHTNGNIYDCEASDQT